MKSSTRILICLLLFLAFCLLAYLIVQLARPEPITQELEKLFEQIANPPEKTAIDLLQAYRKNQPEQVRELLSGELQDRLLHRAALSGDGIPPAEAMRVHTAQYYRLCNLRPGAPSFQADQPVFEDENTVQLSVQLSFNGYPDRLVFHFVLCKDANKNWVCREISLDKQQSFIKSKHHDDTK